MDSGGRGKAFQDTVYASRMREVPDGVRDVLAQDAASRGQSLQQFITQLLTDAAARPDEREVLESIRARIDAEPIRLSTDEIVQAVHEGR